MFIHHVFFWLNNPDSESDKADLVAGLETLKAIEGIQLVHIGFPASTSRGVIDASYSVSWLLTFDSLEAEEVYQHHPIHLAFVANCSHLWSKVIVYDSI
jgi:Stress responsive A/B Barrel Domain